MKIKTVSARIIGQSYSGNLSQGHEAGQSPVHLVMTIKPSSFSRHPARARQIRIMPPDHPAARAAGCAAALGGGTAAHLVPLAGWVCT